MVTKYNKRIMMLLLTVMILFQSFYYNYKESEAMELGMTIAIEEALLYLAGLCGITLAGGAIADLSPAQRRQIKDAFDEGCQQASISQQDQIAWEQKLCEGVLDKTSACWKAFLDSISTPRTKEVNPYVGDGGVSVGSFISTFKTSYTYKGVTYDIDLSKSDLPFDYLKDANTCLLSYRIFPTMDGVSMNLAVCTDPYPMSSYPEFTVNKSNDVCAGSSPINSISYRYNFRYVSSTDTTICTMVNDFYTGRFNTTNGVQFICDRPIIMANGNYMDMAGTEEVDTLQAFPHWESVGAFNGSRTLSDVYNLINSDAVADTGVVNIPWENVAEIPIPMPGDKTEDTTATISGKMEKLWEQLAAGEITWEQFITALQTAVGVTTLEGVIADDVPIEGDLPIVIEQELVPENPDKPKDKEEIIEENISNTAYTFDLKEFFPFCIPFDLYNVISYLSAEPEAPKFDIPIPSYNRSGNLTMANKITVDLSIFDSVALVFRVCIFIVFIIGLIIITRNLIRG